MFCPGGLGAEPPRKFPGSLGGGAPQEIARVSGKREPPKELRKFSTKFLFVFKKAPLCQVDMPDPNQDDSTIVIS